MKPKVLITRLLPEAALALVRQACEVQLDPDDRALSPAELRQAVADKEGIICLITDRIDASVLEAGPRLKVVANVAVGYDNIDVAAATRRGIVVTNTPGVLTETTADLAWGLLLSVARRIPEGDRFVRAGQWTEWKLMLMLGHDVYGQTLGIVGLGRIGQAVARRARGFGMTVLYHNRRRVSPALEAELGATWVELPTLLQRSDFVSLHVPLTAETTHLIGEAELRLMRPTAYLINTARGAVVDEAALIRALQEGWIAGAALDVFAHEPEVPEALTQLDNVVLTPHIGSASVATRTRMAVMAAQNLVAALRGERPPHVVNPEVYDRA
ncbi:MAG: D-glycerate dehydrogenase [Candidatus Tectimicrobiota bacterium]|nr:MAG: D-glycerate dehydrogenase [Candidatus Tectomicrobia bacterium]